MGGEAKERFVVVIDAGHGGHDPGAVANRLKEKNINLDIALKLGKKIQQNCSDTKVIYTRSKDVFVTLKGRTEIGNKAKADLFISIHTNSAANTSAKGTETFDPRLGADRHKYGGGQTGKLGYFAGRRLYNHLSGI